MGVSDGQNMRLFIFSLLTAVGVQHIHADLGTLWQNFVDVANLRGVVSAMREKEGSGDPDMLDLKYFLMNETRPIATCLRENQDYLDLYVFLESNGLDLQGIFSWINAELGWGEYSPPLHQTHKHPRSLKTLWDELVGLIPYSTVLAWFLEMWTINTDMQLVVERMMSPATERIRDHLHTCPAYLSYRCHFLCECVDLIDLETRGCQFVEWANCDYTCDCQCENSCPDETQTYTCNPGY